MDLFPNSNMCSALACLMKKPTLIEESKIKLDKNDFMARGESKFYYIIYSAIANLFMDGMREEITPAAVDEFLSHYDEPYKIFTQNDGVEFLYNIISTLGSPDSYHRHATRIRKFTILREAVSLGFGLEDVYESSDDDEENTALQNRFEHLSVDNIIEHYEKIVNEFASKFKIGYETEGGVAGENGLQLFNSFKEEPQYGVSTCGKLQNKIFRGQLLGASMLRSASTNTFKSRTSLGEATDLAITKWYNWKTGKWESKGLSEKVLYITTEMEQEELEPTIWAYISGVPEERIKDYNLSTEEVRVIEESIQELNDCNSFYIEYIPQFEPTTINAIIKKYVTQYNVEYVFFDYIHLNFQVMMEMASKTRGMTTREDMILGIFAAGLAEIAKEHNIHLSTSTQVNGEAIHSKKLDQNVLRGAKNMADKFTKGIVMTRPTSEDDKIIEAVMANLKGVNKKPNMIWHIYKNRHSKYKGKLYLYVDFDTMRMEDLFMTNDRDELMEVTPLELFVQEEEKEEETLPF
ncbi:helicase DnaB [Staphylococcus pseudintermedius]|nr:helicase DnaB [Staphylococcus pseudintermedius]